MKFEAWGWTAPEGDSIEAFPQYYHAVWSGPLLSCQRLNLACQVSRLLVIRRPGSCHPVSKYLPKAFSVDLSVAEDGWLLRDYYRQAQVGLVTSLFGGEEVVCEYQLCGLPVVTTSCFDRRLEFIDPRFLRIVPDDPASIAAAVEEVKRRHYDPQEVRRAFLSRWNTLYKEKLDACFPDFVPLADNRRYRPRRVPETGCRVLGGGAAALRAMPTF